MLAPKLLRITHPSRVLGHDGDVVSAALLEGERRLVNQHALELLRWRSIARAHPDLKGERLPRPAVQEEGGEAVREEGREAGRRKGGREHTRRGGSSGGSQPMRRVLDVVAFDFAPSYNFQLDGFEFDAELRATQRAVRFAPALRRAAEEAAHATFGGAAYLAAHLRRDGYEHYCSSSTGGLAHYSRVRFGVNVTAEACFPSVVQVTPPCTAPCTARTSRRELPAGGRLTPHKRRQHHQHRHRHPSPSTARPCRLRPRSTRR